VDRLGLIDIHLGFSIKLQFIKCFVKCLLNLMPLSGKHSFNRKSLHHIGNGPNPYEQAISIIGKTLAAFDEDNLIPCFGFGDGMFL